MKRTSLGEYEDEAMLGCIYFLLAHGWLLGRLRYCALGWRLAWQDCYDIVDVVMHNLFNRRGSHGGFDVLGPASSSSSATPFVQCQHAPSFSNHGTSAFFFCLPSRHEAAPAVSLHQEPLGTPLEHHVSVHLHLSATCETALAYRD